MMCKKYVQNLVLPGVLRNKKKSLNSHEGAGWSTNYLSDSPSTFKYETFGNKL